MRTISPTIPSNPAPSQPSGKLNCRPKLKIAKQNPIATSWGVPWLPAPVVRATPIVIAVKACPGLRSGIASRLVTPAPKLVIPAKAGIQRGGERQQRPTTKANVSVRASLPAAQEAPSLRRKNRKLQNKIRPRHPGGVPHPCEKKVVFAKQNPAAPSRRSPTPL